MDLPTLFIVSVYSVVWNCMSLKAEDKFTTHKGLGTAEGICIGVFNMDGNMIASRDPEWIQGVINALIRLSSKVRLMSNVAKSKTMTCQPGAIFKGRQEKAFKWRRKVEGGNTGSICGGVSHVQNAVWS